MEPIEVVAAVRREDDRYWAVRRTASGKHAGLAGMWEYPGGAVEEGETLEAALRREMEEEFGVRITIHGCLDRITTSSGRTPYQVWFFGVVFQDLPTLRVHDAEGWFTIDELLVQKHLPAGRLFNEKLAMRRAHV